MTADEWSRDLSRYYLTLNQYAQLAARLVECAQQDNAENFSLQLACLESAEEPYASLYPQLIPFWQKEMFDRIATKTEIYRVASPADGVVFGPTTGLCWSGCVTECVLGEMVRAIAQSVGCDPMVYWYTGPVGREAWEAQRGLVVPKFDDVKRAILPRFAAIPEHLSRALPGLAKESAIVARDVNLLVSRNRANAEAAKPVTVAPATESRIVPELVEATHEACSLAEWMNWLRDFAERKAAEWEQKYAPLRALQDEVRIDLINQYAKGGGSLDKHNAQLCQRTLDDYHRLGAMVRQTGLCFSPVLDELTRRIGTVYTYRNAVRIDDQKSAKAFLLSKYPSHETTRNARNAWPVERTLVIARLLADRLQGVVHEFGKHEPEAFTELGLRHWVVDAASSISISLRAIAHEVVEGSALEQLVAELDEDRGLLDVMVPESRLLNLRFRGLADDFRRLEKSDDTPRREQIGTLLTRAGTLLRRAILNQSVTLPDGMARPEKSHDTVEGFEDWFDAAGYWTMFARHRPAVGNSGGSATPTAVLAGLDEAGEASHFAVLCERLAVQCAGDATASGDQAEEPLSSGEPAATEDSDSSGNQSPAELPPKPRAVAVPRIVAVAVEVTEAVQFLIQDLHSIREQCEKDVVSYKNLAEELRKNESFREQYLDDELRPRDPEHASYRQLYLSGFGFVRQDLDYWFSGMPPYAKKLDSQLARIDADLKLLGESGHSSVEAYLSGLQLPQRWRGYIPRAWDAWVAIDVARRVSQTLSRSFQALPEGWHTGSETDARWRQMIRSGVGSAANAAEIIGRNIGSEAEWKVLEGEVARDLAHLRDPALQVAFGGDVQVEPEIAPVRTSSSRPDGPFGVNGFAFNGKLIEGIPPKPWKLLDALWKAPERTLEFDDIVATVWGDPNEPVANKTIQAHCTTLRNLFRKNAIPCDIKTGGDPLRVELAIDPPVSV
jgi:hypothetical protein